MKQTGRRWIGNLLGMLLAALLLGTTAFADSADGALGSFVQDKLNELLEEELAPNVPDQAQGMMDSLTQEKEDGGLFSLLSMTPSELLAAIKDAALQQVSGPLEVLGRLLAVALLCAVLSAVRQSAVSARLQGIFLVVATACILSFLGEPVFACIDQTVQALRECSLFVMSFTPVMSGILIAGGNPASAGAYNLILFFAAQILAELAARTLIPLLNIYLALCIVAPMAPLLQLDKVTAAIKSVVCWGLGIITTLFVGMLSLQTVIGSGGDTLLLKASKFLAGSMIPVIGGTISDALGAAKGCVQLLKGTVGSFGILVAVLTFLPALLQVGMWYLSLKVSAWVSSMLGAGEVAKLLESIVQAFSILLALIACFALLILVSTALMLLLTAG